MPHRTSNFWPIWRWPIALGGLSLLGLFAALLGDGLWDFASWLSLAIPLLVIGRFVLKPESSKPRRRRT
ncbi:MAG: hypothetical protein EOO39_39095 [Cytophagaceae bacterium]|nr:MAG: hypothetical protein EOO39_39095 [Cytophagaceae bacterium]